MSQNAQQLLDLALGAGVWISTAESCSAGLIAGEITSVAGSSSVFDRGFVTYTNDAKVEMLGVSQSTLKQHGAVSEEIAREMAEGALKYSNADVAISVTGIAGPGGSEHKPEGRVCFGLASRNQNTISETIEFGAIGRTNVRRSTVNHALNMLIAQLTRRDQ